MTLEEIYSLVAKRLLQGTMIHQQLANYYAFLGLEGYKYCHEYHLAEEFKHYRKFINYCLEQTNKLVPKQQGESLNFNNVIPDNWYSFTREDVDINTKRSAIKNGIEKWLTWEKQTKKFLEDMTIEFININEIGMSLKTKKLIKEVEKEIKIAEIKFLSLKAIDYDLVEIISEQKCLKQKYKEKLKTRKEIKHD